MRSRKRFVRPYGVGGSGGVPGRKSKYCTAAEKKAVADYAAKFGASAAARKYNIPPAVAAYYHRKEYKQTLPKGRRASYALTDDSVVDSGTIPTMVPSSASAIDNTNVDSPTASDDHDSSNGGFDDDNTKVDDCNVAGGGGGGGSPAYLRGRGRGRPKLIGDELDAELVDYMVQVKRADPRVHMTASHALMLARDYISKKSPGLLDDDGGTITLKLTWAMKLCTRVAERQRELYPMPIDMMHPHQLLLQPMSSLSGCMSMASGGGGSFKQEPMMYGEVENGVDDEMMSSMDNGGGEMMTASNSNGCVTEAC